MLYDALLNEDAKHAWAHDESKLPKMGAWEEGRGRWEGGGGAGEDRKWGWWEGEDGVYARPDSLERPYLGLTVERLWGVLLQCSEGRITWRCPNLETGWRTGGQKEDCGCVD